jgi:hypothetical protein
MIRIARCIARREKYERDGPMKITMHTVDLRYTKAELLHLFEVATKEDVEHRGHYGPPVANGQFVAVRERSCRV